MKTTKGRFYKKGEQFVLPEGTPPLPKGIKALWGMKLVGSGAARKWVEASESDFRSLMNEASFSHEKIDAMVKAKGFNINCYIDSSKTACDGDCSPFQEQTCAGYANNNGTGLACCCQV
jgi:hypothetical protein